MTDPAELAVIHAFMQTTLKREDPSAPIYVCRRCGVDFWAKLGSSTAEAQWCAICLVIALEEEVKPRMHRISKGE